MQIRKTIKASILGASGYSGAEIIKFLLRHPGVAIDTVCAAGSAGATLESIYPSLRGKLSLKLEKYSLDKVAGSDVVFLALPSGEAMNVVPEMRKEGIKVIDLSGDFRLHDRSEYDKYYNHEHNAWPLVEEATYGLTEVRYEDIAGSHFITNPGCYATSIIIPLVPLLREGLISEKDIVVNSLSGVSGAGRKTTLDLSFAEVDNSVKAYKVTSHQHIPEIVQELMFQTSKNVSLVFTPHLLPVSRGIYTTTVATLSEGITAKNIADAFISYYGDKPFVRHLGNEIPEMKYVLYSNYIDIGWKIDEDNGKIVILSTIDNLVKGAAGQAVQNMNFMFGFDEREGLL
jgi:N-acetyl-gamma-glutamyl-phosphate reductase